MPFADKFRAMMDFPFPGDTVGGFFVESVDVSHHGHGAGQYGYTACLVLHGPGGQQGVRNALKAMFATHPTTFSGYGNPYQLWFDKPRIESLGDRRYEVRVEGGGVRVYLQDELDRFLDYLGAEGKLASDDAPGKSEALVETYLEGYRKEIKRTVDRYRYRLRKLEAARDPSE
jgi:hypothetical protein